MQGYAGLCTGLCRAMQRYAGLCSAMQHNAIQCSKNLQIGNATFVCKPKNLKQKDDNRLDADSGLVKKVKSNKQFHLNVVS